MGRATTGAVTCLLVFGGCSDDVGDNASSAGKVTLAASTPGSVPGDVSTPNSGSLAAAPEGTDPVCAQLAADETLTGLGEVIRQSVVSGVAPDVSAAVSSLEHVSATFPSATSAANALRAWAAAPGDSASVDTLAAAFAVLDTEVQAVCRFPLS